jgi:hypothetical protein
LTVSGVKSVGSAEAGKGLYSQYQTTMMPRPANPKPSVPPDAATDRLISLSRPTSVANAAASSHRSSQDLVALSKTQCLTVIRYSSHTFDTSAPVPGSACRRNPLSDLEIDMVADGLLVK